MRIALIGRAAAVAVLASTAMAQAQTGATPEGCAELPADSFEAAMLDCDALQAPEPTAPPPDLDSPPEVVTEPVPEVVAPLPEPVEQTVPAPETEAPILETEVEPVPQALEAALPDPVEEIAPAPDPELSSVPVPPSRTDVVQVNGEPLADEEWLERYPLSEPVDPAEVVILEEDVPADLPPPAANSRYAVIDGMIVELDPESYELLCLIRRAGAVAQARELVTEERDGDRDEGEGNDRDRGNREDDNRGDRGEAQALDIPNGHLPPPGSCRVWYPDRPAGHQPPPTSCNVNVPAGAVLIRG